MISTRFGSNVTIIANAGKHQPRYLKTLVTLVGLRYEDGTEGFYWAELLKADNGWNEIELAVKSAPVVNLSKQNLKRAFKDAE